MKHPREPGIPAAAAESLRRALAEAALGVLADLLVFMNGPGERCEVQQIRLAIAKALLEQVVDLLVAAAEREEEEFIGLIDTIPLVQQAGTCPERVPEASNGRTPALRAPLCGPGLDLAGYGGGTELHRLKPALESFWHVRDVLRFKGTDRFTFGDMVWELKARGIEKLCETTLRNHFERVEDFFRKSTGDATLCLYETCQKWGSNITPKGKGAGDQIGQLLGKAPAT